MTRVFLLLPRLDAFDAIANDVLGMASSLRAFGLQLTIVAAGGALKKEFRKPGKGIWKNASVADLLIYHYGIAWEKGDALFSSFPGRKVLRFHNVTPAEFYEPYHSGIANACREGLRRVSLLKADEAWCVSDYNARVLKDLGWIGLTEILPPFHRIEEMAQLPINVSALGKQLRNRTQSKPKSDLRLLFVGRLVPNKSLPRTIRTLDNALAASEEPVFASLRIVGDSDPALSEHVKEIQEAARTARNLVVEFCGKLSQEALKREFLLAHALITFSEHEGFCVPVVEALALGLPVLAMQSEAVRNTLGGCGFFAENEKELEDSLQSLLFDEVKIDGKIEDGIHRYYRNFHPQVLSRLLHRLIENQIDSGFLANEEKKNAALGESKKESESENVSKSGTSVGFSQTHSRIVESRRGKRIALIVARFGEEFAGGSEKEAFDYANLLRLDGYDVDVLTSCARSSESWKNEYSPGISVLPLEEKVGFGSVISGPESRQTTNQTTNQTTGEKKVSSSQPGKLRILRFPVLQERTDYWHKLDALIDASEVLDWMQTGGYALGLEWIRAQGPYQPELILELNGQYDHYLFMTYLYFPVLMGSMLTNCERNFLVPTLHEERPALFKPMKRLPLRFRNLIWNTVEEGELAGKLWNVKGGTVVGAPLDLTSLDQFSQKDKRANESDAGALAISEELASRKEGYPGFDSAEALPTFLYIGRWGSGKGTDVMMAMLRQYNSVRPIRLTILGSGKDVKIPGFAEALGFVSEEVKAQLIRSATAVLVPSPMESFSIVTLESLARRTPVIVNGNNPVLKGHAIRSECALSYEDSAQFMQCLDRAISGLDSNTLDKGMKYALSYSPEKIKESLKAGMSLGEPLPRKKE
ncbi:MAG: glycosyltransferase [Leptospiraceae bacterium]